MTSIEAWVPMTIGLVVLFFWFFREIKGFLFWIYLWQLKNYHIGRFLAHFDTYNGKKILLNNGALLKYLMFVCLGILIFSAGFGYSDPYAPYSVGFIPLLFFIYLMEGANALWGLVKGKLKAPEVTSKIAVLLPIIFIPLIVTALFFMKILIDNNFYPNSIMSYSVAFSFAILTFDIFTPLIVSFIILLFQPVTVFLRNRIIRKAMKKRELMENLLVIGVTGSYGKSSTKEFLKTILSKDFKVVSTERNENSEIGIAQCILNNLKEEHEIFICEMGAYNRGGIRFLCDIAKPKIGILTGINNQHLATFGSQENITKTKFELIESLPAEGLAVLNWDNAFIKDNFKSGISAIKYSTHEKTDLWAEDIVEDGGWISFNAVNQKGESQLFRVHLSGIHNVSNLLGAISVAKKLGMEMEDIAIRVLEISPDQSGMKIRKYDDFDIIDATYSSNVNGIIAHLEYMKKWKGKKVLVMPCSIELGSEAKKAHLEMGRKIGEVCDLAIITSKDYLGEIKRGAAESKMKNIIFMDEGVSIFRKIVSSVGKDGVVLLESRVPIKLIDKLK